MAVTYIGKIVTMGADNDAITTPVQIKALHMRRTAASSGAVQINNGADTVVYFTVNLPGTGTTGSPNGYFLGFGRGGQYFPDGIRLASATSDLTIFLA